MTKNFRSLVPFFLAAIVCGATVPGCASTKGGPSDFEVAAVDLGRKPIILVCPIDTVISDEEISRLSYALAPLIRRDLFCAQDLSVVPTADTDIPMKAYFLNNPGLAKQARIHGADIITVGILRGDSSNISIEFKAYDVLKGTVLFKAKIEDRTSRALRLQRELVNQFIASLGIALSEDEWERLSAHSPSKTDAVMQYGKGLKELRRDNFTEALIALNEASATDPSLAVAHAARAKIFKQYNAPDKATSELESAVETDKYYAEAWYQLNIRMAVYENRNDLAMEYCYEALAVAPRFGKARLSLGARLYTRGNLEEAIEQTEIAAELLPADAIPRYNLGIYYRDSGKIEIARKWLQRALKINPGFELARVELLNLSKK
jgi:Tfp pilus assembly protein PilF